MERSGQTSLVTLKLGLYGNFGLFHTDNSKIIISERRDSLKAGHTPLIPALWSQRHLVL